MASACPVNRSAEASPPVGIMEADAAVKRHPVRYRALIFIGSVCPLRSAQHTVSLLIGQAVQSCRCVIMFGLIACYSGCIPYHLTILDHLYMLAGQIHLCIGRSPLLIGTLCSSGRILRLPGLAFAGLHHLIQGSKLRSLV